MKRKHTRVASLPSGRLPRGGARGGLFPAAVRAGRDDSSTAVPLRQSRRRSPLPLRTRRRHAFPPRSFASCARVCKRWHRLVPTEPELLQTAELSFRRSRRSLWVESDADQERRLRSLLRLLARLKPHVRRLLLIVHAPYRYNLETAGQLAAEVLASVGRCTHLADLRMELEDMPCTLGPWLAPLAGSLHRLHVAHYCRNRHDDEPLQLQPGSLAACTQLQALVLEGKLSAPSAACWPCRITSLGVTLRFEELPASVSCLCVTVYVEATACVGVWMCAVPCRCTEALSSATLCAIT